MDFSLTREQELIRKMIRAFTENEVKPIAAEIDRTHEFPAENIRKLFRLRVISMTAPREYGGAGSDQLSTAICAEEQKRKYLPMLTTGGVLGGMGITEPNAGSDASKSQTQARLAGDHYVINDSKICSSRTASKRACSSSSP